MSDADDRKPELEERNFSQEHYEMLLRCSKNGDVSEWNSWRIKNKDTKILLNGVDLRNANLYHVFLEDANLQGAVLKKTNLQGAFLSRANMKSANLREADMNEAELRETNLKNAFLFQAECKEALLFETNLQSAHLSLANLQGANISRANLQDSDLTEANLEDAKLSQVNLQSANLYKTILKGAYLENANLCGTYFYLSIFDENSVLWNCLVDKKTDFRGVGLGNIRIDPTTRQLLEYNVRRMNWTDWYKNHKFLQFPVRFFWFSSDYGRSTGRIMSVFFVSALLIAVCYFLHPGIIHNLKIFDNTVMVSGKLLFLRSLYFSIVTMTTLGFGDMHAEPGEVWGYIFLIFQVLLGYVILGALVTRLSILFTAGGPAGKFADEKSVWNRVKQCADFIARRFRK